MGQIEKLQEWVRESDNIVFFGGAGVSTESGIPDFRSVDGLYHQQYDYPPETILSHTFYRRNPEEFYRFYRNKMLFPDARPNAAHLKLAELEKALPDNVAMLTVCLDGYGNEDSVKEVLENAGFEGVTLITGEGDLLDLANNLMYTPTTVLADSQGALVGEAIIGGQADLSAAYLEAVNQALEAGGKDAISLEDA